MVSSGYFFKGFSSVRSIDSPAIALACSFIAIGALLKNIGFNFQQSFSPLFLLMHYLDNLSWPSLF